VFFRLTILYVINWVGFYSFSWQVVGRKNIMTNDVHAFVRLHIALIKKNFLYSFVHLGINVYLCSYTKVWLPQFFFDRSVELQNTISRHILCIIMAIVGFYFVRAQSCWKFCSTFVFIIFIDELLFWKI